MIVSTMANSLLTIIDDILDISKIEANKLVMEQIPFSLRSAVFGVLKTLSVKANQKKLDLIYDLDGTIPDQLIGDPLRLRQVITNLIGNAVKFTTKGRVVCTAQTKEIHGDKITLLFCVSDTGIGIDAGKLNLIFDTFQQADGSTTRKYGGTGLGLSISKRLVVLMGGELWVHSVFGKGSQFYFTVQCTLANTTVDQALNRLSPYSTRGVVVVDTKRSDDLSDLVHMLEILQLHYVVVHSMEEAGVIAAQGNKQVPRTDMLIVDDLEIVEKLRELSSLRYVPIILMSPNMPSLVMKISIELGISSYINQPVQFPDLVNALYSAMENYSIIPSDSSKAKKAPLNILLAEDNIVNQKLAVRILEKFGHKASIVSNGLLAVEAVKNNRYDLILMDVQMPIMGGFEATQHIREWELESGHRTPIVALTAHAMIGDREKCIASGMDDYVSKPLRFNELMTAINKSVTINHNSKKKEST
jgi:osomolarity two-component system sensor histidine kinase NIK1